jgi:capsular polysaccharide biosynthesis protein
VPIHNTKVLQIEYRSERPEEAAAIANAVAEAYQKNRDTVFQEATNKNVSVADIARVRAFP